MNPLERLTSDRLRLVVGVIAAATVLSGIVQLLAPGVVLGVIGAETSTTARHFFAIVGMFMAIVGGLVLHVLWIGRDERTVVLWGSVQKLGASVAVGLGVARGVFGGLALFVAAFDLFSAAVMGWLWTRVRR